jgi:hypothetical protein
MPASRPAEEPGQVAGLFVNYRQADQPIGAAALDYLLAVHFGRAHVFRDCVSVAPGADYAREIMRRLRSAEVLVVIIGAGWLDRGGNAGPGWPTGRGGGAGPTLSAGPGGGAGPAVAAGLGRGAGPGEWVRQEIRIALRLRITIVPVLLGDRPPPGPDDLPADIRAMARCQAARIRHTSFGADVRALLDLLERHVTPSQDCPPGQPAPDPASRPRRWPRLMMRVAAPLAALAVPAVLAGAAFADPRDARDALAALAAAAVLALLMFGLGVLVVYAARGWSDSLDRQVTTLPATGREAAAFGLVVALLGVAAAVSYPLRERLSPPPALWLLLAAVGIVTIGWAALQWLRQYRLDAQWPPAEVRPDPAAIRAARARLLERMNAWAPPLSRQQRIQAERALRQLEEATAALRELAGRRRRFRPRPEGTRHSAGYPVWVCGTVGLVAGATLFDRRAAWPEPAHYPLAAVAVLLVATVGLLTGELRYRHQRWQQQVVVAESSDDLRMLWMRLAHLVGAGLDPPGADRRRDSRR